MQCYSMKNELISKLTSQYITDSEFCNALISAISNDAKVSERLVYLEILADVFTNDPNTFRMMENCFLSDSNEYIRAKAADLLLKYFPYIGSDAIRWGIFHENSTRVLELIYNTIKKNDLPIYQKFMEDFKQRLTITYKIDPKEALFLFELELLMADNTIFGSLKPNIYNSHIIKLELYNKGLISIPDSIKNLDSLKLMNLWDNQLTNLPKSLEHLNKLEELYLDWNKFSRLPNLNWNNLKSLKKLSVTNNTGLMDIPTELIILLIRNFNPKYIQEGVNPQDALVLSIFEILIGQKLMQVPNNSQLNKLYACHYRINNEGELVGIYIYGHGNSQIGFIPEELFALRSLEDLILRGQNIKHLSANIGKMGNLKSMDFSFNDIRHIPQELFNSHNLRCLDLSHNFGLILKNQVENPNLTLWV
jgi:Leucine-rich repeat (LRR) protein